MAVTSKMTIYHKDQLGKRNSEIFHTTLKAEDIDQEKAIEIADWGRQYCQNITTDNYEDIVISSVISINETAAE